MVSPRLVRWLAPDQGCPRKRGQNEGMPMETPLTPARVVRGDIDESCPAAGVDCAGEKGIPILPGTLKVACSSCNLRELCLPVGLREEELERLDSMVGARRSVKRGAALYNTGDSFLSIYAVRTG